MQCFFEASDGQEIAQIYVDISVKRKNTKYIPHGTRCNMQGAMSMHIFFLNMFMHYDDEIICCNNFSSFSRSRPKKLKSQKTQVDTAVQLLGSNSKNPGDPESFRRFGV